MVLDAALAALYETPIEKRSAPILPDLAQVLSKESLIEEEYQSDRDDDKSKEEEEEEVEE